MKIENKNCIHCEEEEGRKSGTEGAAESEATIRGGLWHLLLWHSHVHLLLCGLYNVVFTLCVCVCDYTYTNKQCHTHCSSTLAAAAATAVVVVVLVGIFGLQSSFDCFSLCH